MIAARSGKNKRLAKGQAIMLGHHATFGRRVFAPIEGRTGLREKLQ
jgi:hypothetical protein